MDPTWVSQMALRHFAEVVSTPWQWFRIVSARVGQFPASVAPPGGVSTQVQMTGVLCELAANGRRFSVLASPDGRVVRWSEIH